MSLTKSDVDTFLVVAVLIGLPVMTIGWYILQWRDYRRDMAVYLNTTTPAMRYTMGPPRLRDYWLWPSVMAISVLLFYMLVWYARLPSGKS